MVSTTRRLKAVSTSTGRLTQRTTRWRVLRAVSATVANASEGKVHLMRAVAGSVASIWGTERRRPVKGTWRVIRPIGTWVFASADWLHRLRGA